MSSNQTDFQLSNGPLSTSNTLVRRAQVESQGPAWEELLGYYEPFVHRTLARMQIENAEIDDVCQQVLVKLWKELGNFKVDKERARFRTWLTRLIRNIAIDDYRKRKRSKLTSSEGLETLANRPNQSELEQLIEFEWQQYVVELGMRRIRSIFTGKAIKVFLRSQKGEPMKQISESLDLTKESAYVLSGRVKKRLIDEVTQIRNALEYRDV